MGHGVSWCTVHHDTPCPTRTLLTWSDRGGGPAPDHHGPRPSDDRGPILRLLDHAPPYERVVVLVTPAGLPRGRELAAQIGPRVELRHVEVADPSDYDQVFRAVAPLAAELEG